MTASQIRTATRRDPEATRVVLEKWLRERLPQAEELRVVALGGPNATGFSNETLLFDLAWREGGRETLRPVVVRCAPSGEGVFPEYDIAQQHRVLDLLARTDVPVPAVLWLEPDARVLGVPFFVMQRIEGRIPTDNPPYHVGGWVTEIPPAERTTLWRNGIDVLGRIHRLDWQALGLGWLDTRGSASTPLERQLDQYRSFLAWAARGRPQPTCDAALAWLVRERPRHEAPVAFCWGDARPGNMIFQEGRVMAVLDWEMATLGDPQSDLAWWILLDRHHSEGLGAPRLPGFPSRAETVAHWEAASGFRASHLDYYEAFAAFRFAVIMIRVADHLLASGLLPAESDFRSNNTVTRLLARMLALPAPG